MGWTSTLSKFDFSLYAKRALSTWNARPIFSLNSSICLRSNGDAPPKIAPAQQANLKVDECVKVQKWDFVGLLQYSAITVFIAMGRFVVIVFDLTAFITAVGMANVTNLEKGPCFMPMNPCEVIDCNIRLPLRFKIHDLTTSKPSLPYGLFVVQLGLSGRFCLDYLSYKLYCSGLNFIRMWMDMLHPSQPTSPNLTSTSINISAGTSFEVYLAMCSNDLDRRASPARIAMSWQIWALVLDFRNNLLKLWPPSLFVIPQKLVAHK